MTQYTNSTTRTKSGTNRWCKGNDKRVVVYDHYDKQDEFISKASQWLRDGSIRYLEDEVFGIENTPAQFCKLMRGENFGKTIVTMQ